MIIQVQLDDWPRYRAIRLRSLQESPSAYGSSFAREIALTDGDWQERVATAPTFLAVDDDDTTIGTVTAYWSRDGDMHLLGMYVDPAVRGRGWAEQLIDAVVAVGRARGAVRIVLKVTEGNAPAARCYTRYGFAPTGRISTRTSEPARAEHEYALALEPTGAVGESG